MMAFLRDLRDATRALGRQPRFSLTCVLILALAIGATTAVLSVVDQTVFRSAPYAYADRLVDVLGRDRKTGGGGSDLSPAKIVGWRAQSEIFEAFEGYTFREVDVTGGTEPQRLSGLTISTGLLPMLGVQPSLGRGSAEDEGRLGSDHVVLISDRLWKQRVGADKSAIGRQMLLNDEPYTIVGVMPRRFRLLTEEESFWLPQSMSASATATP